MESGKLLSVGVLLAQVAPAALLALSLIAIMHLRPALVLIKLTVGAEEGSSVGCHLCIGTLGGLKAREEWYMAPGASGGGRHRTYILGVIRGDQLWPHQVKTILPTPLHPLPRQLSQQPCVPSGYGTDASSFHSLRP
jgi:hypothetical protein